MRYRVLCPKCGRSFNFTQATLDANEEDGDHLGITCPACLREFDPFAREEPAAQASDVEGLETLANRERDAEDRDP